MEAEATSYLGFGRHRAEEMLDGPWLGFFVHHITEMGVIQRPIRRKWNTDTQREEDRCLLRSVLASSVMSNV